LSIVLLSGSLYAQVEQAQQENESATELKINSNILYGKIVDKVTGKGIEAGSVQLYPGSKQAGDSLLTGMLSKPNGEFRFRNLPAVKSLRVVISALGYQHWEKTISVETTPDNTGKGFFKKDLGNIVIQPNFSELADVTVVATKPALEMGIDRKIFNVEKSLVATGGTAVDIMKNIPSVSVDIDGNVELRNSTPQIFVDGRPTILTLDQIPADHIEKIELITNPSAKFDAASSGGIINVVLMKNKRVGLNGVVSLSGGTPSIFNSNLNLNLRQGKFNFFASAGHNESGGKAKGQTLRQNKKNGVVSDYFNQHSINERSRNFTSIRFGTDFFINNRNTVTISQDMAKGKFGSKETQDQEYLDQAQTPEYYGERISNGNFEFNRKSTRLSYKYSFPKQGKELTADINYNYGTHGSNSNIINQYHYPNGTQYRPDALVRNAGNSDENQVTFQVDFSDPITDAQKIETGFRTYYNRFTSFYDAFAQNNGQEVKLPLSNNYMYDEAITAAYFTYSYKKETFSYQLGLRGEYSKFDGELIDSAYKFGYEYPNRIKNIWDALFPSLFVTKKINDNDELQFNYSRRIRRPRFWELNPFIDINDPANIRQGNPQLKPEYINSFELNYNRKYKNGNILAVLYFTNNPKDITQYSDTITAAQYQQLNNAAIDPNAILNTFINANTTNRYGLELTIQHKAGKNFDITPTFNLQYRTVNAAQNSLNLSNSGFNWESKLMVNYKIETKQPSLFNNLGFQLISEYQSPRVIPQGKRLEEFNVDFALRKDFLKDKKASLTFAINDVLNTRRSGTIYDTDRFYQDSYRRWDVRSFRLSFTYKFGDANFSLLKKNRGGDNAED
jgi:outer membrane receptor protein involved in Fe transport